MVAGSRQQAAGNKAFGEYIADIGIECHVQLKTASKLFCSCSNDARGADPNTVVCPVCFGMPGTLPVLNRRAIELAIRAGLALDAEIAKNSKFDRKNYFYPDLPKGYQITQFDEPIVGRGEIEVPMAAAEDGETFKVGITRAHLEEDAGKLQHPEGADYSLVDLNRAGTPLLEIVSEPDMHSPEQAKAYALELYNRMRYSGVSDVDLYHGNMRFDINVSVRKQGAKTLGTRSETKNLNSFRSVERAAEYEIKRQIEKLEKGQKIIQETRGFDESTGKTVSQRSKEEAMDYRYFPEPDLPPLVVDKKLVEEIKKSTPTLLPEIRDQLKGINLENSIVDSLINYPILVRKLFVERDHGKANKSDLKKIANWLAGPVVAELKNNPNINLENDDNIFIHPGHLTKLSQMVEKNQVSSNAAKNLVSSFYTDFTDPMKLAKDINVLQVSDSQELETFIDQVIKENPKAAEDVKNGEMKAVGFLTGQVMKLSRGQANPQKVQEMIRGKLK